MILDLFTDPDLYPLLLEMFRDSRTASDDLLELGIKHQAINVDACLRNRFRCQTTIQKLLNNKKLRGEVLIG